MICTVCEVHLECVTCSCGHGQCALPSVLYIFDCASVIQLPH